MSKPKSNAKLLFLPEEQQAQLADWLLGGMPYWRAQEMVKSEFGVEVHSLSPFTQFWELVCTPQLLNRRKRASVTAKERAEAAAEDPAEFNAATLDALRQKAYELAENANANPKDVKAIMTLLLKARDQDLAEKQLALDKDKFQFDAAKLCLKNLPAVRKIAADSSLNETDRIQAAMKIVFGDAV